MRYLDALLDSDDTSIRLMRDARYAPAQTVVALGPVCPATGTADGTPPTDCQQLSQEICDAIAQPEVPDLASKQSAFAEARRQSSERREVRYSWQDGPWPCHQRRSKTHQPESCALSVQLDICSRCPGLLVVRALRCAVRASQGPLTRHAAAHQRPSRGSRQQSVAGVCRV